MAAPFASSGWRSSPRRQAAGSGDRSVVCSWRGSTRRQAGGSGDQSVVPDVFQIPQCIPMCVFTA
eukprot:350131-Chlamydomonas_euryale.AAC.4